MKPKPAAPKSVLLSCCPDCKHDRGQYGECLGGPKMDRMAEAFGAMRKAGKLALEWLSDEDPEWEPYKKLKAALKLAQEASK